VRVFEHIGNSDKDIGSFMKQSGEGGSKSRAVTLVFTL